MVSRTRLHALLLWALLLAVASGARAEAQWRVDGALWAHPRAAQTVLGSEAVTAAVRAWERSDDGVVVIRYPGGAEGELWAAELRDWLVALGVPSARIERVPGGQPGGLGMDVRKRGDT